VDDEQATPKDGVTLRLLCVKEALRAGLGGRPLDLATARAGALWTGIEGCSIEDLEDRSFRVLCRTCGERHRLKRIAQVAADGGLEAIGADYAVLVDVLLDDKGLVGDAALEHLTGILAVKLQEFEKVGRNDPCPCGSGKKSKKCCGRPN